MDFNVTYNKSCSPTQIVSFEIAVNDISNIAIYDDCGCVYDINSLEASYSLDNLCWSCWMTYKEVLTNTIELKQDFYVRFKVKGVINKIEVDGETFTDYGTQLDSSFELNGCNTENSNVFNPYANMEGAISLGSQLSEAVSCVVGIPCYYIKLSPDAGSKDLTFKEYALYGVESIKQIKIVIQDNMMPSSKPEFSDFGLDWQTDWEVEVTKGSFATAFGNTAQPTEGDLVYIPMMKRMWMVNEAYEEKKDALMWIANTFKLALAKYQEKDSVELGDAQTFVDSVVKNKYEDLFGEDDDVTQASNEDATEAPLYAASTLYNVYESDAVRKRMTCDSINITSNDIYYKGALISDCKYDFLSTTTQSRIIYQSKYCGDELSISFVLNPLMTMGAFENSFIKLGPVKLNIMQEYSDVTIYVNKDKSIKIDISANTTFFVVVRWSRKMNIVDLHAYRYTYNQKIPLFKVGNGHKFFDMDNPVSEYKGKYNMELAVEQKSEIELNNIYGWLTNFKLFDIYVDNLSDLLQMYPNHQHLVINDTARKLVDLPGVKPA